MNGSVAELCICRGMDEYVDGWMHEWVDGQGMGRWTDEKMNTDSSDRRLTRQEKMAMTVHSLCHHPIRQQPPLPVDPNVGEGPSVEVLGHGVQARDEAVHQAFDRVVLRLPGLFDHGLFFVFDFCGVVMKGRGVEMGALLL